MSLNFFPEYTQQRREELAQRLAKSLFKHVFEPCRDESEEREKQFILDMNNKIGHINVSDKQLNWLKQLHSKYCE